MSTALAKVNTDFSPDQNFWELNPQLIYMPPFHRVYQLDDGGTYSSKMMYCVVFVCEPDESVNKFFRHGRSKIESMLKETYFPEFDFKDKLYLEVLESYSEICFDSVKKSFLDKKKSLKKLATFLNGLEYSLDNITKVTAAQSKIPKLYEEYERIEALFFATKGDHRIKGGRKQSKAERKEV